MATSSNLYIFLTPMIRLTSYNLDIEIFTELQNTLYLAACLKHIQSNFIVLKICEKFEF